MLALSLIIYRNADGFSSCIDERGLYLEYPAHIPIWKRKASEWLMYWRVDDNQFVAEWAQTEFGDCFGMATGGGGKLWMYIDIWVVGVTGPYMYVRGIRKAC
jgi:hypothetical protein